MNSRLAMVAAGYGALLVYASLYPFAGWNPVGVDPFGILTGAWTAPTRRADNLANVLAYLPLGLLLALSLRGIRSFSGRVILATLAGLLLSFSMEFLQQYLPRRVPSHADLATNASGALIGALLSSFLDERRGPGRILTQWRVQWVKPGAHFNLGLIAVAAWALSQWIPGLPSLDLANLREGLAPAWQTAHDLSTFDLLQWGRYALYLSGLALLVRTLGNPGRPAVPLFFFLVACVFAYKVAVIDRHLSLEALAGAVSAMVLTVLWIALRVRTVASIAALFIVGGLVCAHFLPGPGSPQHLANWAPLRGPIDHPVIGLGSVFEILWPPAALGYLARIAAPSESRRSVVWGAAAALAFALISLDWHQQSISMATIVLMAGTLALFGLLWPEPSADPVVRPHPLRRISSTVLRLWPGLLVAVLPVALPPIDAQAASPRAALRVGPQHENRSPSAAAKIARDGDLIEIEAGLYAGDAAVWTQSNLTIRGIGGRAHLRADGAHAEGKAIWVIKGANTTIENVEFSGAKVAHRNGAGIRLEGPGLTVRNCRFFHNENGILSAPHPHSDILIERSEFAHNGFGDGQSHNLYIGTVRSFTLRHSYVHHAVVGHNVKSRALKNIIEHNRIMDERDGRSSYAIDLPDGGLSFVIGNVLHQGPRNDNKRIMAYGAESYRNPSSKLHLVRNTLVNDDPAGGHFVFVRAGAKDVEIVNNVFSGLGEILDGPGELRGNVRLTRSEFQDPDNFDFRLRNSATPNAMGADSRTALGLAFRPAGGERREESAAR